MLLTIIFMMHRSVHSLAGPLVIRQQSHVLNFPITFIRYRKQCICKDMLFSVLFRVERSTQQQLLRYQISICPLIQGIIFLDTEPTLRMMVI